VVQPAGWLGSAAGPCAPAAASCGPLALLAAVPLALPPQEALGEAGGALFDGPCPFPLPEPGEVEPAPVGDGAA
jgi:hypothetical protein